MQIAKHWRRLPSRLRLEGKKCSQCNALLFPYGAICRQCGSTSLDDYRFSGRGIVRHYSVVHQGIAGLDLPSPYIAAMVELEEGIVVPALLTDVEGDDIEPDMPVEMVTRKMFYSDPEQPIDYGYKFAPVEKKS